MKIIAKKTIEVLEWEKKPIDRNAITVLDHPLIFGIAFSSENPARENLTTIRFEVKRVMEEKDSGVKIFLAHTRNVFEVNNDFETPELEFLSGMLNEAFRDFEQLYKERTLGTNLEAAIPVRPKHSEIVVELDKVIDTWKVEYKKSLSRPKINWKETFKYLPEIPQHKRWRHDTRLTRELEIAQKLFTGQTITDEEKNILLSLGNFYKELDTKLIDLDFASLTDLEIVEFDNYLFYAFNFIGLTSRQFTIQQTYRLVVNEYVTGKDEEINHERFLKYPPKEVVKKIGRYNRANTPNSTLFYSGESINTALREIRPPKNKKVTVGIWRPVIEKDVFSLYVISHGLQEAFVNNDLVIANKSFEDLRTKNDPMVAIFMENYFNIFGREFTKRTKHHKEFMVSALLSDRMLDPESMSKSGDKACGIKYPSVGNDYKSDNIAMLPSTFDSRFKLYFVLEFEITEEMYEVSYKDIHPDRIQVAKINKFRSTGNISKDGSIIW